MPRPISSRITRLRGGGRVEDPRRLGHLDHEGALAAAQLVAGPHAGENAVGTCRCVASRAGTKLPICANSAIKRRLADVGALAGHVRAGNQQDVARLAPGQSRRWARTCPSGSSTSSTGCRPSMIAQHRLLDDLRPAVVALPGQLGQGRQHVQLRQHGGRGLHPPPRRRHRLAQLQEQLVFQLLRLLVGRQHLLFIFLQLGRDVALGILHRLLADVVVGNPLAMGVGDLEVVAEDLVEADLERGDAGPLASPGPGSGRSTACRRGPTRAGRPAADESRRG